MEENNNIENLNTDSEMNFGIPKGYFEGFESRLRNRMEIENELKEFPVLNGIEKENPFIVPGNYFESRDFITKARKNSVGQGATIQRLSSFSRKYKLAIAAIFIVLAGIPLVFKFYIATRPERNSCIEIACLSKEDITSSKYFEQISLYDLESLANAEVLDSMRTQISSRELLDEIMKDPDAMNITDEDLGI